MFDRQQSIREAVAVDVTSTDQLMPANKPTRAVYVAGSGVLVVELAGKPGTSVSYTVLAGSRHSLQVSKFVKTGTTATGIVAEF